LGPLGPIWQPIQERLILVDSQQFSIEAARIAADSNAENVILLDLRGLSPVANYFLIATGNSDRQLRGICDAINDYAKKIGEKRYGLAGYDLGQWVLADYVTLVVHLFDAERRSYYDLEMMWGDAPRIDWSRSASA